MSLHLSRRAFAPLRQLQALAVAALLAGCVDATQEPGARVSVQLEATSALPDDHLPETFRLVLDHVELLACEPAHTTSWAQMREAALGMLGTRRAHAAHLPPAPHRLLASAVWHLRLDAETPPIWTPGIIEPPLRDWCGVRFGFYAALPDTPATLQGMSVGQSLLLHSPPQSEVSGSLGFDVVARQENPEAWLSSSRLRDGQQALTLRIDLDVLQHALDEASDAGHALTAAIIAQAFVDLAEIDLQAMQVLN